MSTYFSEIIIPPLPKKEVPEIVPWVDAWMHMIDGKTNLMVRCPICARTFVLCEVDNITEKGAELTKYAAYYHRTIIRECPDNASHWNVTMYG